MGCKCSEAEAALQRNLNFEHRRPRRHSFGNFYWFVLSQGKRTTAATPLRTCCESKLGCCVLPLQKRDTPHTKGTTTSAELENSTPKICRKTFSSQSKRYRFGVNWKKKENGDCGFVAILIAAPADGALRDEIYHHHENYFLAVWWASSYLVKSRLEHPHIREWVLFEPSQTPDVVCSTLYGAWLQTFLI